MPDVIGPAMLAVGQGMNSFSVFLPNFTEIRRADPHSNPEIIKDVRMGEVAAVTVTLGIGVLASSLTQNAAPAYTALAMSIMLVVLYESSLRSEPQKVEAKKNG